MMTPLYAALLGLMLIMLSIKIIKTRRKYHVSLGDANSIEMKRCMRAQANFSEYTPIFLILLAFSEMKGLSLWAVNLFGTVFFVGRIMHAYSLLRHEQYDTTQKLLNNPKFRIYGMTCTLVTIGSVAIIILIQSAI